MGLGVVGWHWKDLVGDNNCKFNLVTFKSTPKGFLVTIKDVRNNFELDWLEILYKVFCPYMNYM
jgi:hypothetical protein